MLSSEELQQIMEALHRQFSFSAGAEITLEANPDDINAESLQQWRSLGFNRLSIGIQSFAEEELRWMNRAHTAGQAYDCIRLAKENGFSDLSADLIYGSPLLSDEQWKKNVDTLIEMQLPHISCYALTVEPKTALDKMISRQQKAPVDPEKQARQFLLLMRWMKQAGYEHYEISNFALPGHRSRHNSSYWQGQPYFGFGPSAHAFDGQRRRWNIANNSLYIQSLQQDTLPFEEEILTPQQQLNEYIMISLRTMEGCSLEVIEKKYGADYLETIMRMADKYLQSGKLLLENNHLVLTKEGKLFADGIAADLFF